MFSMTWLLADIVSVFITWTDLSLWDVRTGERPWGVWWTVLCIRTESEALLGVFCNCVNCDMWLSCDYHTNVTGAYQWVRYDDSLYLNFNDFNKLSYLFFPINRYLHKRSEREERRDRKAEKKFKITPVLKHSLTFSIFRSQSVSCSRALIDLSTSWRCSISAV